MLFLIPALVVIGVVYAAYSMTHHRHATAGAQGQGGTATQGHLWPTSAYGWVSAAAVGVGILLQLLVNVVQVPFLGWGVLLAALVLALIARLVAHDRSTITTLVLAVAVLAAVAVSLFLLGEVVIGHD